MATLPSKNALADLSGGYYSYWTDGTTEGRATVAVLLGSTDAAAATATFGALEDTPIGATTASTGAFTTLTSSGAATLNSLGVTGAATVGTTLGVTGAATFSSSVTLANGQNLQWGDGSAHIDMNATSGQYKVIVSNASRMDYGITTGSWTINDALSVTGAATFSSTVSAGITTLTSTSAGAATYPLQLRNDGAGAGTQAGIEFYAASTLYGKMDGGFSTAASIIFSVGNPPTEALAIYEASTVVDGTLTLASGSITDSGGSISFGNENLSTTGTLDAGVSTFTRVTSSSFLNTTGGVPVFSATGGAYLAGQPGASSSELRAYSDGSGTAKALLITASTTTFTGNITTTGTLASGAATVTGGLIARSGTFDIVAGADDAATTVTNSVNKTMRFGLPHYSTAEENVALILGSSQSSVNVVSIGGGSSAANAATSVGIYAAANNTTITGTKVAEFTSSGATVTGTLDVTGDVTAESDLYVGQGSGVRLVRINSGAGLASYHYFEQGSTLRGLIGVNGANSLSGDAGTSDMVVRSQASLYLLSGGNTTALTLDSSQNATFAGDVTIDGGTGVATSGVLQVQQSGDTVNDGIGITSSNATSHRIWKNAGGALNIGPSTDPDAWQQDLSGNVTMTAGDLTLSAGSLTVTDSSSSFKFEDASGAATLSIDGSNGDFVGGDYWQIIADGAASVLYMGGPGGASPTLELGFAGGASTLYGDLTLSAGDLTVGGTGTFNTALTVGGASATTSQRLQFADTGGIEWHISYLNGDGLYFLEQGIGDTRLKLLDGGGVTLPTGDLTLSAGDLTVGAAIGTGTTTLVKSAGNNADEISLEHSGNTVKIASLGQINSHGSLVLRDNSGTAQVVLQADSSRSYLLNQSFLLGATSTSNNAQFYATKTYSNASGSDFGAYFLYKQSVATTGNLRAIRAQTNLEHTTGTVASAQGVSAYTQGSGNGGTTTNVYNLYSLVQANTGHTITNAYGVFISAMTGGAGTITNDWGLYSETSKNHLAGDLRIGTTSATSEGNEVLRVYGSENFLADFSRDDSNAAFVRFTNTATGTTGADGSYVGIDGNESAVFWNLESTPMLFATANTERFRVASNAYALGIGTTDVEAWDASHSAIEFGRSAIWAANTDDALYLTTNAYYDGTNKYKTADSGGAAQLQISSGAYIFKSAGSGAADGTITWSEKMRLTNAGVLAIGTTAAAGNELLRVNGLIHSDSDSIIIDTAKTPASAAATGTQGQIAWDSSYIYICTATNTWRRAAHSTW